jgi:hypothetical protein
MVSPASQSGQAGKTFENLFNRLRGFGTGVGAKATTALQKIKEKPGTAATLGTAAFMLPGAIQGGLSDVASLGAGLAGGGLAARLTQNLPGTPGKIARVVAPILGTLGTSAAAEQLIPRATAGIPSTQETQQRSEQQREREFQREQLQADVAARSAAELAANKELYGYLMTKEIEAQKAQLPIIERLDRSRLVNAQAMLASETAAYQQLARTAIAGKSLITGQQERGATMRQALATNPYMGSILRAPQISFG